MILKNLSNPLKYLQFLSKSIDNLSNLSLRQGAEADSDYLSKVGLATVIVIPSIEADPPSNQHINTKRLFLIELLNLYTTY